MGDRVIPALLLAHDYVVVDVETTGLSPYHDSIIEIAAVHVTGGTLAETFHTLVDPGVPLPPFISSLTGISDADIRGKPRLGEIADALLEFLEGRVFVAHNANFDYNFVRQGLRRHNRQYRAQTMCTMLLGRQLLPQGRRSSLDALLAQCGIAVRSQHRHRAEYDVEATAQLFFHLAGIAEHHETTGAGQVRATERDPPQFRYKSFPSMAHDLPSSPGVYVMRDENGQILYIGKSKDVRKRVQTHFRPSDSAQPRLKRALPLVSQVEAVTTGSELEALLLESRLIKRYLPSANIALRDYQNYPFIRMDVNEPFPRASLTRFPQPDGAAYYGPFTRSGPVHTAVELVHDVFKLARCTGDIVPGVTQPCFYGQIGRCSRPCTGEVSREQYRSQVDRASRFLDGSDREVIGDLERRRDKLADELRFEEAAELRDRIAELDYVFGTQQRLHFAVTEQHLIVVAPSIERRSVELFCIRAGRLARHERWCVTNPDSLQLQAWIEETYGAEEQKKTGFDLISKEEVDEMHIIASWLHRSTEPHSRIDVHSDRVDAGLLASDVLAAATALWESIAGSSA